MKKCIKRMLTCVLALAMLLSLAACGSGESDTKTTAAAGSGETAAAGTEESYPTIKVMMSCLTVPKDVAMVEEAVSAITREKIGANVEFIMMEYANQTQQLNLLLSAGDDSIDVFWVKDFPTAIASGQAMDITELIEPYADEISKTIGANLAPFDSWLVLRGIQTLAVRMDRAEQNAMALAHWLKKQPQVSVSIKE